MRCTAGAVWDVMVDIRKKSPNFGKWFGITLSHENGKMAYIPTGFAHGFLSLEPKSEVIYLSSEFYNPEVEGVLAWDDTEVGINWPSLPGVISDKDQFGMALRSLPLGADQAPVF